jgi:3-hydroxybutyrate dehydrogenase
MVEAPFRLVRASLPRMYEQGYGRIINISSAHGLRASPFKVGYVTAKHAMEGMSKVVALEGGPYGVTSNCINPGYVRTPLVEKQIADQARAHGIPESDVLTKVLLADNPVKRMAEPDEIAELAVYLCSPDASYITGASLSIDGGWTAS